MCMHVVIERFQGEKGEILKPEINPTYRPACCKEWEGPVVKKRLGGEFGLVRDFAGLQVLPSMLQQKLGTEKEGGEDWSS